MNILDKIVSQKREALILKKKNKSLEELKDSIYYNRKTISLSEKLVQSEAAIISEFKRRSPSKSDINMSAKVEDIVPLYQEGGAAAVSVLTDEEHFKGSSDDLIKARSILEIPILRKDFIVDPYQVYEAKAIGADVILLISYCLEKSEAQELTDLAQSLGLEI